MSSPSLHAVVERPGERTLAELLEAHTTQLAAAVESIGVEDAARASGLEQDSIAAIADGDTAVAAEIGLDTAATLLASIDGTTEADALMDAALDELLFGMTAGVLNVDMVAAELDSDLDAREVQQALEGRYPVTLGEFVELQRLIASRAG